MNIILIVAILLIILVISTVIRAMLRVYRSSRKNFPLRSIILLTISLFFLVAGIFIMLYSGEKLGELCMTIGGFFGLLESFIRRKKEAARDKEDLVD